MKFPNHILLDVSKSFIKHSSEYWIFKYLFALKKKNYNFFLNTLTFHKKFFLHKEKLIFNKLIKNQKKFTIRYSFSNPALFLTELEKKFHKKVYEPRVKVKRKILEDKFIGKEIYDFLINSKKKYDEKTLKRLIRNFSLNTTTDVFKNDNLWSLFNINFLRKEKIYTKLKYSRVPQYDIVSGGAAALFAGFLGFLITEKFGFELLDSADFYFLFMYLVFFFFACRLFLKIMDGKKSSWNAISLKWLIFFYKTLIILVIKSIKNFYKFFNKKFLKFLL